MDHSAPLPRPAPRPFTALLAAAVLAGGLSESGPVWSLAGYALLLVLCARPPRRLRGAWVHQGLGRVALALWFGVALLHASASRRPQELFTGTWRPEWRTEDGVVGRLVEGGGRFEVPEGVLDDGERVRLEPRSAARRAAGAPDFVRAESPGPGVRRVEVDETLRLAAPSQSLWSRAQRALRALRRRGVERLAALSTATTRGLAAALVFGDRSLLPRGTPDLFTRTGTRHALAVSGLHVALIAALWIWPLGSLLAALASRLPCCGSGGRRVLRQPQVWRASLLLALVPLTGAGAPVVRATLALVLSQLAGVLGARSRSEGQPGGLLRPDPLSLWSLALLLEWLADPRATSAVSVLLSYGATLGLLLFARPIGRLLRSPLPAGARVSEVDRLGRPRGRARVLVMQRLVDFGLGGLAASAAANLATLPVVWFVFGEWSWVGALATLLLLPLLATFLGLAWAWLLVPCEPLESALDTLAAAQLGLLRLFDQLPGTPANLPTRPLACLAALALLTFACAWRPRLWRLALAGWSLAILPWRGPPRSLEVHALDVGSGTAVLVRAPGSPSWLFDAGSRDRTGVARSAVAPLLRELDVGPLAVALSHGEVDHAGALPWLVERYPPVLWAGALPAHIDERLPHGTSRLDLDRGRLELCRSEQGPGLGVALLRGQPGLGNEGSRDLELRFGPRALLLCGDAEQEGRGRMLMRGLVRGPYDLLLFPHHGSDTPWLSPLLEAAEPTEVWFSSAREPAVARELSRRGQSWDSTHRSGALSTSLPGSLGTNPAR